jgi:hypothetical protein
MTSRNRLWAFLLLIGFLLPFCSVHVDSQTIPTRQTVTLNGSGQCVTYTGITAQYGVDIYAVDLGSFSGTLTAQNSPDNVHWNTASNATPAATLSTTGKISIAPQSSAPGVRACLTAYSAGSLSVTVAILTTPSVLQYSVTSGGSIAANVTVVAPTDGAGRVIVTTPPPASLTVSPLPLPVVCGTAVSFCAPTPIASVFVTNPQATVFVANTPAVVVANTPGVTVQNTPAVTDFQGTNPWIITFNGSGQPVFVVGASASPLPTGSAGYSPAPNALPAAAYLVCVVPAGAASSAAAGNAIAVPCDATGRIAVSTPAPVTQVSASIGPITIAAPTDASGNVKVVQPAPSATQPVSCAAAVNCPVNATQVTSPWVVTTINPSLPAPQVTWPVTTSAPVTSVSVSVLPTPTSDVLPTATAGVSPAAAYVEVQAVAECWVPTAGTNIGTTHLYPVTCTSGGSLHTTIDNAITVTTPAPCSTATCAVVVYQGTSPWTVTTINPSLPAPQVTWPVTTAAPITSLSVSTVPTPTSNAVPTASAGAANATQGVEVNANSVCVVPAGATPNVTSGNRIAVQCDANGRQLTVVYQGTSPWAVTTINPSLPAPQVTWPVTTAAPITSISVSTLPTPTSAALPTASAGAAAPALAINDAAYIECIFPAGATPNVSVGNAITAQCNANGQQLVHDPAPVFTARQSVSVDAESTTLPVNCTSGCSVAAATPMATASAGLAASAAPLSVSENECIVPAGGTPNASAGNIIALQCNANGQQLVHDPAPVFTGTQVVSTPSSGPAPTASVGAALPGNAVQVFDYPSCVFPIGATPNANGGNAIPLQCDSNGNLRMVVQNFYCAGNVSTAIFTVSTTLTELVATSSGKIVHVCGVTVAGSIASGNQLIKLIQGTKVTTACDTTALTRWQAYYGTAQVNATFGYGMSEMFETLASQELCGQLAAGTPTASVVVSYVQI